MTFRGLGVVAGAGGEGERGVVAVRVMVGVIVVVAVEGEGVEGGLGKGGAYSCVACLCHFNIDHASLARRGTVPTPDRDSSQHLGAYYAFPVYVVLHRRFLLLLGRGGVYSFHA